ncbi:uncharacterized protein LOC117922382 [Vitis riparia]|uniref:uncharacterized protein LOC117922382 n=1 Tax=Vitis riparia TaxID=96939 RepID=UPI00155AE7D1|nr:uncharacterized protein LOC117922382 [Vitis riparia]
MQPIQGSQSHHSHCRWPPSPAIHLLTSTRLPSSRAEHREQIQPTHHRHTLRTGARAMQIFPESMRKLWNEWELRFMVLLSLFLQIVLIIFSKRRKYTVTPWIRILIWSAYLSADWVATVSLGTLSNSQGDSEGKLLDPNYTLMAFWAPFLSCTLVVRTLSRLIP